MAVKKSQIYSSLWKSCDALRGGMDASQYKDYILTLLFLKYVSDRAESDPEAQIDVPAGCKFSNLLALKGDKEIGEKIDKIIDRIAEQKKSVAGWCGERPLSLRMRAFRRRRMNATSGWIAMPPIHW